MSYLNLAGERQLLRGEPETWQHVAFPALWPDHGDAATDAMRLATTGGEGRFVASHQPAGGPHRWWDVIITPARDAEGHVLRLVATARDITQQRRADEERLALLASEREARSEAERAARIKDDFVSTLSHELRTPLNAILGWVGVLRQDQQPDTLAKAIDVIDRNSRRQSQMIDDLLDMGRILSGKMRLEVQRVELATVIEEAILSAQPSADAKGVRLLKTTRIGGHRARRLRPPAAGGVEPAEQRHQVHAARRPGAGHPAQGQQPGARAGERHRRRHRARSRGARLRSLPAGGCLDHAASRRAGAGPLDREEPRGTARRLGRGGERRRADRRHLHRAAAARARIDAAESHVDLPSADITITASLAGLRVLVLDDEEDARDVVTRLLQDAGAAVTAAGSAADAQKLLEDGLVPDVVVSDVGMPDRDGYDFIQAVRRMPPPLRTVPAAALTALARLEDRKRALLSGFQTHLAKPVDPAELVATVASLAGRTGRT